MRRKSTFYPNGAIVNNMIDGIKINGTANTKYTKAYNNKSADAVPINPILRLQ